MSFLSPIWLVLLLPPWVALAVWLLWSRRGPRTDVPFLALWRGEVAEAPRERRRHVRPPPIALVAALMAALLAILAAARPGISLASAARGPQVTIILDRGITMSVGSRRADVIDRARAALEALGDGPTTLIPIPDGTPIEVNRSDWAEVAKGFSPTARQTRDAVQGAARRTLENSAGPVIVLSDAAVAGDPRLVQLAPSKTLRNAAVTNFVVRQSPRPQAMVTVANVSAEPSAAAVLRVRSGEQANVERAIALPARGEEMNVFVDLPALDGTAVAELDFFDDLPIDNLARAARQRGFPRVEIRSPVPPEVRRIVEAYARARPAGEMSRPVAIVGDGPIPTDLPVAIAPSAGAAGEGAADGGGASGAGEGAGGGGAVQVAAHPVSAGVDWTAVEPQPDGAPPGPGWRAIVSVDARPAVAVRESPHRQVWIGFDAADFARAPQFVIFWSNLLDWLGGAEAADGGAAMHWSATIVPPISIDPPPQGDAAAQIASFRPAARRTADLTSAVLLASVICLAIAAVAWPRGEA